VSARQFRQSGFVEQVVAILRSTGADPNRLTLELTETVFVQDVEETIKKMTNLRLKGVRFALDDFGTGYSSIYLLKRLPFDQLKIDRSFVRDVLDDPNDAAIVDMIVSLGRTLGLDVVAEGVETAEQQEFLVRSGCLTSQGYLFSRPLILERLEDFARDWERSRTDPRRDAAPKSTVVGAKAEAVAR
jgi:EAL domain-containing protein (putative c-di-GMP-specific phosphodiesterase class I)